jgi:hypothetical protein
MIENKHIREFILPLIKEEGRMIDFYLVKGLIENTDKEILNELQKFQNTDYGFGNALEPDIRMPNSSIACTNMAVQILQQIKDQSLTEELRQQIVTYYENVYIEELGRWRMVDELVDNYPRAIWWNYESVDSFTYGNPNPEIIGFLYQNMKYLKKLNINKEINKVIKYIETDFEEEASMHSVLSMLHFYSKMDKDVKYLIKEKLQKVIIKELEEANGNWKEYGLEPYKISIIDKKFLDSRRDEYNHNLIFNKEKIMQGLIHPNWNWHQFEEVFNNCKKEWNGYLTFNVLKALRLNRTL